MYPVQGKSSQERVWGSFHDDSSYDCLGEYNILLDADMPETLRATLCQSPHQQPSESSLAVDRSFATPSFPPIGSRIQPVLSLYSGFCFTQGLVALVAGATSLEPVDFSSAPSKKLDRNLRPYIRFCAKHIA